MTAEKHNPQEILLQLRQLNSAITTNNRAMIAHLNLKDNDLAVLDTLDQHGPLTPSDIAQKTHTHVATMTGILTRLEKNGWITKEFSPSDRRSVLIHMTGSHKLSQEFQTVDKRILALLSRYDSSEQEVIANFTREIVEIIQEFTQTQEKK